VEVEDEAQKRAGGDGERELGEEEESAGHPRAGYSQGRRGCQWRGDAVKRVNGVREAREVKEVKGVRVVKR
jgi:hypothetical protein